MFQGDRRGGPNKTKAQQMAEIYNVCFIGAGTVNFGGVPDPWNHSKRLEQLGSVKVVAIVDPLVEKAQKILAAKLAGNHADMYSECKIYGDVQTALQEKTIHVGFIGKLKYNFVYGLIKGR